MKFVTFITYDNLDKIQCLAESEWTKESLDNAAEWIWQESDSKETAIKNHCAKMDEWELNPDKEIY